jgi:plasmid stabilization system protein ParE
VVRGPGEDPRLAVNLVLRPEAEADILEAFRWYESKRVGLGEDFLDETEAAFARITEVPDSFPVAHRGLRRAVLKRFPYLVYFRHEEDVVRVFAVLHGRRDRKTLGSRVPR